MNKQYYSKKQIISLGYLTAEEIEIIINNNRFDKYIVKTADDILFDKSVIDCIYYKLISIQETERKTVITDDLQQGNKYLIAELEKKQKKIEELTDKIQEYADKFIEFADKSQNIAESLVISNRENNIIKAIESGNPQKRNLFKKLFQKSRE